MQRQLLNFCLFFLISSLGCWNLAASAIEPQDPVVLDMLASFKKGDRKRLSQQLPLVKGHLLEPWAAYWELRARLDEASESEIHGFFNRFANTYQEDRLRADWLLLLGSRRDWTSFKTEYPSYRMRDDRELQCYSALIEFINDGAKATPSLPAEVYRNWLLLREADEGCTLAVDRLNDARKISDQQIWRKARVATDNNRPRVVRAALEILSPLKEPKALQELLAQPQKYLMKNQAHPQRAAQEWVVLALIRMAASDPDGAARHLAGYWQPYLSIEQRNWAWAAIGKQSAMQLDSNALKYYEKVGRLADLNDDLLAWRARAGLRLGQESKWEIVQASIQAMSAEARAESTWKYWHAKALMSMHKPGTRLHQEGLNALSEIAGIRGFYEQLAMEEIGQRIIAPARPEPPTAAEKEAARSNPGLRRALYAIQIGLRSEGVREWNYSTNLVNGLGQPGRMSERETLAAAALACEEQVYDRCINTMERAKDQFDLSLAFPMPHKDEVLKKASEIGIDPAYVYGLIRQESRFVTDARSVVGAAGLMQVMPATAKWTAKKIGLTNYSPDQIHQRDVNIAIGTGFLKIVLDNFEGSMPMAAAAYNAGPSRVRKWRMGPVIEGAIWAENVPFNETRDYVKKVLSNATAYAALITSEPQSLKSRLGSVGPRTADAGADNGDIP
jgi:soluble lytic murein transglycosylase